MPQKHSVSTFFDRVLLNIEYSNLLKSFLANQKNHVFLTMRFGEFKWSKVPFLMLHIKCNQPPPSLYDLVNLFRLTSIYSMPRLKVLNCYDFFVLTDVNLALLSLKKRLPHVTINEKRIIIAENGSYKNGIWDVKAQQLELDYYQMSSRGLASSRSQ